MEWLSFDRGMGISFYRTEGKGECITTDAERQVNGVAVCGKLASVSLFSVKIGIEAISSDTDILEI